MPHGNGVRKSTRINRSNNNRTKRRAMNLEDLLLNGPESKNDRRVPKAMNLLKELEIKHSTGQITDDEERVMIRLIALRNRLNEIKYL